MKDCKAVLQDCILGWPPAYFASSCSPAGVKERSMLGRHVSLGVCASAECWL